MLDPFVQLASSEKGKKFAGPAGETFGEMYGHSIDTASPRPSVGLWVGRLLIRMGEKLAKQDIPLKRDRENA